MFDPNDPRSALSSVATVAYEPSVAAAADYVDLADGTFARGQNFVLAYDEPAAGQTLARSAQPDEYFVLLPDAASRFRINDVEVAGNSLAIIPPGDSSIEVIEPGRIVRVFTTRASDLVERCVNGASYSEPHPFVAPLEPWPDPPDGFEKVRVYSLDVPAEKGRFGRIWRSTNIMVNWGEARPGPRDVTKMSPHSHPDFEQCSLVLEGEFVHHLRWPWTTNLNDWREDDHQRIGSPSITVIPPTTVHTSQAIGLGDNLLIDIFCPPRVDFSEKPGWVLNAAEYPMPNQT
jgi:hypothetical protein